MKYFRNNGVYLIFKSVKDYKTLQLLKTAL